MHEVWDVPIRRRPNFFVTDRRALRRHARVEERTPDEHVEATFDSPPEG